MVSWSAWGLHGGAVELVRLVTIDQGFDWCELSHRRLADWLNTDPRHARRILQDLVDQAVVELVTGEGRRAHAYRLADPRGWRGVPWRFESPRAEPGGVPEVVRRRLDFLADPPKTTKPPVVARYSAPQGGFVARRGTPPLGPLWRAPSAPQADSLRGAPSAPQMAPSPSSTSSGQTAPGPQLVKEEEEARLAPGGIELTGAARAVAEAIVRTGTGPVLGRLRRRLAAAFEGVEEGPVLRLVLEAVSRAAGEGQRPPALVALACDMWAAGAAAPPPVPAGPPAAVRLAELYLSAEELRRDLEKARAEGAAEVVSIFEEQLARCETEIESLEERRAG